MRLEVTRRAGLAVRAVAALAPAAPPTDGGRPTAAAPVKSGDLAAALDTTAGFMPQVVGPLVKAGWVRSIPGPAGGYVLTDAASGLSVLDVVEAVDGPTDTGLCAIEGHPCGTGGGVCALHESWARARAVLVAHLATQPAASSAAPAATVVPTRHPTKRP